jgi:hypothetical protein
MVDTITIDKIQSVEDKTDKSTLPFNVEFLEVVEINIAIMKTQKYKQSITAIQ